MSRPARPGGAAPPRTAALGPGDDVELTQLAQEVCRRYSAEFPDELERYGDAGAEWCVHDNLYLLAWAIDDVRLGGADFFGNVAWLHGILESRDFPAERLARNLELAGAVAAGALPHRAGPLEQRFQEAARRVRAGRPGDQAAVPSPVLTAYLAEILDGRPAAARAVIEQALAEGLSGRELYLDVLQPALHEIGRLWAEGQVSIAQEHLATATTSALLHQVASALPRARPTGRTALVAGTEGELHAVGVRFVVDFLEAEGWDVIDLGASTPAPEVTDLAAQLRPDILALSTTLTSHLDRVAATVTAIKALPNPPLVALGGSAYRGDEKLARELGADLYATDAGALVDQLRERFADTRSGAV